MRRRASRRSVSSCDSPGPRVPTPPPSRSRCCHMPRMRGRLYSSCASSTWSLPSALTACWAKMSRISCVPVDDARLERVLERPLLRGAELVVDDEHLGPGVAVALLQLRRACPCRRTCAGPGCGRCWTRRLDRPTPAVRASSSSSPSSSAGSTPWASTATTSPRSGSRPGADRAVATPSVVIMTPARDHSRPRRPHARARERARPRAATRRRWSSSCAACSRASRSTTTARRSSGATPLRLSCSRATSTPCPRRGTCRDASRTAPSHGVGATDMKGGRRGHARARARRRARPLPLLHARGGAARGEPAAGVFAAGCSRTRELAVVLEPTDCTLHAGCLGNLQARVDFHGESAHSARPWTGRNAIHELVRGLAGARRARAARRRAGRPRLPRGAERGAGLRRHRRERRPGARVGGAELPLRARPEPRRGRGAAARARPARRAARSSTTRRRRRRRWRTRSRRLLRERVPEVAPKQAWTPVAQFAEQGIDAINYGPGAPAYAHRVDELIPIANLERCFATLRDFLASVSS